MAEPCPEHVTPSKPGKEVAAAAPMTEGIFTFRNVRNVRQQLPKTLALIVSTLIASTLSG